MLHQNKCKKALYGFTHIKQQNVISQYYVNIFCREVIISCLQLIRYTCTKLVRGQGDVRRKRPNVTSAPHCSTFFLEF